MQQINCDFETVVAACQDMIDRFTYTGGEMWPETLASIEADPFEGAEALRKTLNVGKISKNASTCGTCKETIESRNRHDFVTCSCGSVSVDGGTWYCRRSYKTGAPYEDIIEEWPWLRGIPE